MPVEIRELVIQAKLNDDVEKKKKSKTEKEQAANSETDDCEKSGMSSQEKHELREEIIEYLKEYFYNERLR